MTLASPGAGDAARLPVADVPVVLVHGYLGGARQWQGIADAFEGRPVLAVDLPGFAGAAAATAVSSIEGFAGHVIDELDARHIDRFIVLGHSMGGMIAQEIARQHPQQVERLVLYGTGPLGSMPDRFEPLEVSLERLDREGVAETARRITATWFVDGTSHPGHAEINEIAAMADPVAARAALLAMAAWDGRPHMTALEMPTLILWGDRDRSYRWPQVEALWRHLPNVSLAVIPGASHAAHAEKPKIFIEILRDFLRAPNPQT